MRIKKVLKLKDKSISYLKILKEKSRRNISGTRDKKVRNKTQWEVDKRTKKLKNKRIKSSNHNGKWKKAKPQ